MVEKNLNRFNSFVINEYKHDYMTNVAFQTTFPTGFQKVRIDAALSKEFRTRTYALGEGA